MSDFENSMSTSTFVERMRTELTELQDKITKLEVFLKGPIFTTLPPLEHMYLGRQHNAMKAYAEALGDRLKMHGG